MSDEFRTALGRTEERWSAQLDRLFERFEKSVDRLEAKFDQRMDASDKEVQAEFGETRVALGELRDGLAMQRQRIDGLEHASETQMGAAAQGAARGAGEAAGAVATAAAAVVASNTRKPFIETSWGKAVVVGTGISAVTGALGLVPAIVKYGALILKFLGDLK